jgi:hypothetical protein
VLEHVNPEKAIGEGVERRLERGQEGGEAEVEGLGARAALPPMPAARQPPISEREADRRRGDRDRRDDVHATRGARYRSASARARGRRRTASPARGLSTAGCGGRSFFSGDYRLGPAPCGDLRLILARDLRGMKKTPAVDMSKTYTICRTFTGATGLEPATSGVTDHFSGREVHDDAYASALFMRFFGAVRVGSARLRDAGRDVCCPSAACSTPSLPCAAEQLPWVATGCRSSRLSRFRSGSICDWLPLVAPAGLHKCSMPEPNALGLRSF